MEGNIEDVVRIMFKQVGAEDVVKATNEVKESSQGLVGVQKEQTKTTKELTKATGGGKKGFKDMNFEFLGTMFYGKVVADTFKSMLKPAADLFGMTEILGSALQVFFLPIMEETSEYVYDFADSMMNADEDTQMLVGSITLLLAILGTIGLVVGQSVLGWQSIGVSVKGLSKAITKAGGLIPALAKLKATIIGIAFSPITLALAAAVALWVTDFEGFRDFVKGAFKDVSNAAKDSWGLITGLMEADGEKIKMSANNLVVSIGQLLLNTLIWVANASTRLIIDSILTPLRMVEWMVKLVSGKDISGVRQSIHDMIPTMDAVDMSHLRMSATPSFETGGYSPASGGFSSANMSPVNVTNNYNVQVSDKTEFQRMLEENSKNMEYNLLRQINLG